VYWSNQLVNADGYDSNNDACTAALPLVQAVGAQANYTYLDGLGAAVANANVEAPHAVAIGSCDVASNARAVSLTTDEDNLDLVLTNDFILVDMPALNYDLDDITADDVVSVRVTLIKSPCGTIFADTIQIGTMCAVPPVVTLPVNTLVYPYFTAMDNDNWWDGFVVTNLTNASGSFTALVYEQDGDMGAFTGTVDANSLFQSTLATELAGATLVTAGTDGVLGNSLCYILVCTDFTADGFAFMGNQTSNSLMANESMGYIPRVDYFNVNDSITFCNTLGITPGVTP
jgi:hypothetical protein